MSHNFPENKQQRTPQLSPFQGSDFSGTHINVYSHKCTHSFPHSLLSLHWVSQKNMAGKSPPPLPQLLSRRWVQTGGPCHPARWGAGVEGADILANREERKYAGGRPQKKKHYFNSLKSPILESAWTQLSMLVGIHPGAADFPRKSNFPLSVPSWTELTSLHSPAQSHILLLLHVNQLLYIAGWWLKKEREPSGPRSTKSFQILRPQGCLLNIH